jgi:hypothetical protein
LTGTSAERPPPLYCDMRQLLDRPPAQDSAISRCMAELWLICCCQPGNIWTCAVVCWAAVPSQEACPLMAAHICSTITKRHVARVGRHLTPAPSEETTQLWLAYPSNQRHCSQPYSKATSRTACHAVLTNTITFRGHEWADGQLPLFSTRVTEVRPSGTASEQYAPARRVRPCMFITPPTMLPTAKLHTSYAPSASSAVHAAPVITSPKPHPSLGTGSGRLPGQGPAAPL